MGRYSSTREDQQGTTTQGPTETNDYFLGPYSSGSNLSQPQFNQPMNAQQQAMYQAQLSWPKVFPKPIVGLDRDGVINVDKGYGLTDISEWEPIPGAYEAIRTIRLKGYKVVILSNQGGISKGLQTQAQVDAIHDFMLKQFGEAGIFSIDGLLYSETSLKEDYYAKPNVGMFHRAEEEFYLNKTKFKQGGFYVGDKMSDLKAAMKIGAKPILVKTGYGTDTVKQLNKFSAEKIKKKTKVYENLLEFAKQLK